MSIISGTFTIPENAPFGSYAFKVSGGGIDYTKSEAIQISRLNITSINPTSCNFQNGAVTTNFELEIYADNAFIMNTPVTVTLSKDGCDDVYETKILVMPKNENALWGALFAIPTFSYSGKWNVNISQNGLTYSGKNLLDFHVTYYPQISSFDRDSPAIPGSTITALIRGLHFTKNSTVYITNWDLSMSSAATSVSVNSELTMNVTIPIPSGMQGETWKLFVNRPYESTTITFLLNKQLNTYTSILYIIMTVVGNEQRVYGTLIGSGGYELHIISQGVDIYESTRYPNDIIHWFLYAGLTGSITINKAKGFNGSNFSRLYCVGSNQKYNPEHWISKRDKYEIDSPYYKNKCGVHVLTYKHKITEPYLIESDNSLDINGNVLRFIITIQTLDNTVQHQLIEYYGGEHMETQTSIDLTEFLPQNITFPYTFNFGIYSYGYNGFGPLLGASACFIIEYTNDKNISLNTFNKYNYNYFYRISDNQPFGHLYKSYNSRLYDNGQMPEQYITRDEISVILDTF